MVASVGNPAASGRTYNVAGEEILILTKWLDLLADVLDTARAKRDLGFHSTPPAEWLPGTVAWWRNSPSGGRGCTWG